MNIVQASTAVHYTNAVSLFKAYAAWLNIDLAFQAFDAELLQLPQMYSLPQGCILLAEVKHLFVGCVAIRKKAESIAELKRMYVQPNYLQQGIGQALLAEAILQATQLGYSKILLDTLANMLPAISLYKKFGFVQIPAYYYNPQPNAVFFELIL